MNSNDKYNFIDLSHDDEDVIVVKARDSRDEGRDVSEKADAEVAIHEAIEAPEEGFSSKSLKPDVNRQRTTLEDLEKLTPVSLTQKIVVALSLVGIAAFLVFFFVFK